MSGAAQLPTVPGPGDVVTHVALHFAPAAVVGVVVWLVGSYQSVKGWAEWTRTARDGIKRGAGAIQTMIEEGKRAAVLLGFYSALTVAFSYMLAITINVTIVLQQTHQDKTGSWPVVKNIIAGATWPPAASWTVVIVASAIGLYILSQIANLGFLRGLLFFAGVLAFLACIGVTAISVLQVVFLLFKLGGINPQTSTTKMDILSQLVDIGLCAALALLLMGIASAANRAFKPHHR